MSKPGIGALHRLAPVHRASTPEDVAESLVALHSTDPASVHLAVAARTAGAGVPVGEVDRALHDDRTIVRVMGHAGPTIWWSGRIVGGWAQRSSGEVVARLLVDVGRDGRAAVEAEASRLQDWLDASGTVVKPRFPTPVQKELAS